jgi:hypothetical protein
MHEQKTLLLDDPRDVTVSAVTASNAPPAVSTLR